MERLRAPRYRPKERAVWHVVDKKEESIFEVLFDLATLIPWQVSVVLALVLFGGLHWYATSTPPALDLKNPGGSTTFMLGNLGRQAANLGKYLLPLTLLAGAGVSLFRRKRQAAFHSQVAGTPLRMPWSG